MPSSVISSYNYNPDTEDLIIRYVSGLVYCYQEVPEKVFKEFKASISKGRYLNFHIKGKFRYQKVEDS
ncbi:MAG TPA: KTSC domain-containing protein [Daejeonella sp.]|nr:KTSC domain-containing protein [Daejeonella sp.]